jgi:hypothetical protein
LRRTGRHSRYDFFISKLSHFWFDCIGCDQLPEKIILSVFQNVRVFLGETKNRVQFG